MAIRAYTQPYSSPMTRVWISLVTVKLLRPRGEGGAALPPKRCGQLVGFGVLVDQRTGDLLVFELVAAALDLGQVDGLVGSVVARAPRQVGAEAAVEVVQSVGGVLQPLPRHLETERLHEVAEDGGAHVAGLGPGRVVHLRVVLLDRGLVLPQAGGVLVVGLPVGGGDGAFAVGAGEVRRDLEVQAGGAGEGV